jgi:hypothetical protein
MNKKINERKKVIIELIQDNDLLSLSEIKKLLPIAYNDVADITLKRDLTALTKLNVLNRVGQGRSVKYEISPIHNLNKKIDLNKYFETLGENRKIIEKFNFDVLNILNTPISPIELDLLENLNKKYRENISKLSDTIINKEYERIVIDLSWKSSKIEGNTYSLLETEALIKQNQEAVGKSKEETQMILNHKETLDYISKNKDLFKNITIRKIENIHQLLTNELGVGRGLRKFPVGISGTKYKPLDNPYQIKVALEKMCQLINNVNDCFTKAFLALILISYIQPFEDDNKRTARLTANALLIAFNACPISYKTVDEVEYKKAILLFYEQNSIFYIKNIFIDQFKFAVNNYFLS